MLRALFGLVVLLSTATASYAGCANYTDGSTTTPAPEAEICYKGVCEKTTLDFECGNVSGAMSGYANGWRIDQAAGVELISRNGVSADAQDIICTGECRFPTKR